MGSHVEGIVGSGQACIASAKLQRVQHVAVVHNAKI